MKVSIIIPSYNQEEYLREAIESAISQTEQCEVIVIDDGSTDNSLRIAKEYEPEVKVIKQVNKGLSAARNTGIMNATGEWIFPLDADDFIAENCIEMLLRLAGETDADIVGPSIEIFGQNSGKVILSPNPGIELFRLGNHLGYFSLYKKSMALALGGYSPKMIHGYEDYHFWINALMRGYKIVTTPEILAKYRTKEKSMWKEAHKEHHAELMAQIYKDFPDFLPKEVL